MPKTTLPLLAAMLLFANGASAQLEEIVVTAEFRETDVQDTAIAVTAMSGEMLDARGQTELTQITAQAPNVTLAQSNAADGPAMLAFIRGVGQTDFNYAVEPGVGIYVDDVYFPTLTGTLLDLLDLERVEVLRGPQGTLAGRNSIGGSIRLFSKRPGDSGGFVSATFGNYDRIDLKGSADFELVEDSVWMRVSGLSRARDGYVTRVDYRCENPSSPLPTYLAGGDFKGCKLGTQGGLSSTTGRVSLRWEPSDSLSVTLIGDALNDESEAAPQTLLFVNDARNNPNLPDAGFGYNGWLNSAFEYQGTFYDIDGNYDTTDDRVYYSSDFIHPDLYKNYTTYIDPNAVSPDSLPAPFSPGGVPPIRHNDQWGVSAQLNWQISDLMSLTSITAYREYEAAWGQDADVSPINSQQLLQRLDHQQFSQELRLSGVAADGDLNYTVGLFHFEQNGTLTANVNLYYAGLHFIHGPDPTPSETQAAFANLAYRLTDNLEVSAGIRQTSEEKTYIYRRRNPDGSIPPPCNLPGPPYLLGQPVNCAVAGLFEIEDRFTDDRTDYRVALNWNLNDSAMTYLSFATGYKGGGVNPRPFFPVQVENVAPETLDTYELGFKSQFLDNRMRLNAAVFFNEYDDIQLQQVQCEVPFPPFFGAPCLQPGNAGSADVWGIELETEFHISDRFFIDASLATLDFEYTEVSPDVAVTEDMITPMTPELTWHFGAQYDMPLAGGRDLSGRVDVMFTDDYYGNSTNAPTNLIEDRTLTNVSLTWRSSDDIWAIRGEVMNATDEEYITTIFDQFPSSGTVMGMPGLPRTYAVSIRRNFD